MELSSCERSGEPSSGHIIKLVRKSYFKSVAVVKNSEVIVALPVIIGESKCTQGFVLCCSLNIDRRLFLSGLTNAWPVTGAWKQKEGEELFIPRSTLSPSKNICRSVAVFCTNGSICNRILLFTRYRSRWKRYGFVCRTNSETASIWIRLLFSAKLWPIYLVVQRSLISSLTDNSLRTATFLLLRKTGRFETSQG